MSKELKTHMRKMLDLMEADITQGPWTDTMIGDQEGGTAGMYNMTTGKKVTGPVDMSKAKEVSLASVFGGEEYNAISELGYKWFEKLSEFSNLREENSIPRGMIARVERVIGRKLDIVDMSDALDPTRDRRGNETFYPMNDAWFNGNSPETVIIRVDKEAASDGLYDDMAEGDLFLANRTGAKSYYRMWMRIV